MMKRLCQLLACIMALSLPAAAATLTIAAGSSQATIQATINSANTNDTVLFSAGLYNIGSTMTVPCNKNLTITGPVATPSTAILNATFTNNVIFSTSACTGVAFKYLAFKNAGGLYFDANDNSNITIVNNQFLAIPDFVTSPDCCGGQNGVTFDGFLSDVPVVGGVLHNLDQNITIENNTFGDSSSCPNSFATGENNGACGGVIFSVGEILGLTMEFNHFFHVNEGIHFNGLRGFDPGHTNSVGLNVIVNNNYFQAIHRIAFENQVSVPIPPAGTSAEMHVEHNVDILDGGSPYYGSLSFSMACCGTAFVQPTSGGVFGPSTGTALYMNDNVFINTTGSPNPYFVEFWGSASQGLYSLVQGYYAQAWTYNIANPASISQNYMCVPNGWTSGGDWSGFITQEEPFNPTVPAQNNNLEVTTGCAVTTSVAPTISPASGSYTSPPTITLTQPVTLGTSYNSGQNTSTYYTTDGSTPVPGSGTTQLYTGPFAVTLPATVKAVGMWGVAPEPLTYPANYGYVPSAVQSATYTSAGGLTLSSVALNNVPASHTLAAGASLQENAYCTYSDASVTNCTTTDVHGNGVSTWASSNTAALTISPSGVMTGVAPGSSNVTAVIAGLTTPAWPMTVTSTTVALSSVALATTGGISSLAAGAVNQLLATCTYSDSSTTNCATTDAHGNVVNPWASSAPSIATVSSSGVVTGVAAGGTNLTAIVSPSSVTTQWGQTGVDVTGFTSSGFINSDYIVLGSQAGGYSGSGATCSFYLPSGTLTVGSLFDCGLIPAPTPTTQGTAWQCYGTYTVSSTSAPNAFVTVPMSSCGLLAAGSAWWVGMVTNSPGSPNEGFTDCGGNCAGSVPTVGNGTYPYFFIAVPYGTRTGMPTAMNSTGSVGRQASQYVTLGQPGITSNTVPLTVTGGTPTFTGCYEGTPGSVNTMTVGGTLQFSAFCQYSSGPDQNCTVADIYGDAVTAWNTSDATKVTIGAVGSSNPGLATAIAAGTANIQSHVGSHTCSPWGLTVSNPSVTLTGVTLATTGGVTGLLIGSTNQLIATCTYSDGSTTNCTTTDSHGNLAGSYASSSTGHATVNSSGLITGMSPGTTNLTAHTGSFTSPTLGLTVLAVPTGVYTITITGPVTFKGSVEF